MVGGNQKHTSEKSLVIIIIQWELDYPSGTGPPSNFIRTNGEKILQEISEKVFKITRKTITIQCETSQRMIKTKPFSVNLSYQNF